MVSREDTETLVHIDTDTFALTIGKGATPSAFNVAFAPCDATGAPGTLNRYVFERLDIPVEKFPSARVLARGYAVVHHAERDVILIVTIGTGQSNERTLQAGLTAAFADCEKILRGRGIWIPLLGTGAARIDTRTSLEFILGSIIASPWIQRSPKTILHIDIPPGLDRKESDRLQNVARDSLAFVKSSTRTASHAKKTAQEGNRQRSKPSSPRDAEDDLPLDIREWSSTAKSIWRLARSYSFRTDRGDRLITTEVMLLALSEIGRADRGQKDSARFLFDKLALGDRQDAYSRISKEAIPEPSAETDESTTANVSPNADRVRERAASLAKLTAKASVVHARHILGALLSSPEETGAVRLLGRLGVGLGELQESFLLFLEKAAPSDDLSAWRKAFSTAGDLIREGGVAQYSLSDRPAEWDALGFTPYVEALAAFIASPKTKAPLTIAIEGEWGSGKSTFMTLLQKRLTKSGFLTVTFNPWRHQEAGEALWASFILTFIEQVNKAVGFVRRWRARASLLNVRWRWKDASLDLAKIFFYVSFLLGFAVAAGVLWAQKDDIVYGLTELLPESSWQRTIMPWIVRLGGVFGGVGLTAVLFSYFHRYVANPFSKRLQDFFDAPNYLARRSTLEAFQQDFQRIVDAYRTSNRPVVVFIDDLDRCAAPRAGDLLRGLNALLAENPQLVLLFGIDRLKVAASLAVEHKEIATQLATWCVPGTSGGGDALGYGLEYVEKFFQLSFRVPSPGDAQVRTLLEGDGNLSTSTDVKTDERNAERNRAYDSARTPAQVSVTTHSWVAPADSRNVRESAGRAKTDEENVGRMESEYELAKDSRRVQDLVVLVAPALGRNPRRIKQFLNHLRLQGHIAITTGLLSAGERDVANEGLLTVEKLGKFVAIGLRWPRLLAEAQADNGLIGRLQVAALGMRSISSITSSGDGVVDRWVSTSAIREFFLVGYPNVSSVENQGEIGRFSLEKVDFRPLLVATALRTDRRE